MRANAISFGQDDEFNAATVFYLLHEAPKQGRIDVIRNAIRIAADAVIIVDISPSYAPSMLMLTGEPFIMDYLASIDTEVREICEDEGYPYRSMDVIPGHVRMWTIDTSMRARITLQLRRYLT